MKLRKAVGRVPYRGVTAACRSPRSPAWPDRSGGQDGQADHGIIAQGSDTFQGHVAGALDGPFVVLFEQDGPEKLSHAPPTSRQPTWRYRRYPASKAPGSENPSIV